MKKLQIMLGLLPLLFALNVIASDTHCWIGEVEEHGNSQISVEVGLGNPDSLAGFQMPVSFDLRELSITCDSVSFSGGRCEGFEFLDSKIDNEKQIVYITGIYGILDQENRLPLLPGEGVIARIFFTYEGDPTGIPLRIRQTTYQMGANKLEYRFWKPDGEEVNCRFEIAPMTIPE